MSQKIYNRSVFFIFHFIVLFCFVFSFSLILMPLRITFLLSKRATMSRGLGVGLIKGKTPDGNDVNK